MLPDLTNRRQRLRPGEDAPGPVGGCPRKGVAGRELHSCSSRQGPRRREQAQAGSDELRGKGSSSAPTLRCGRAFPSPEPALVRPSRSLRHSPQLAFPANASTDTSMAPTSCSWARRSALPHRKRPAPHRASRLLFSCHVLTSLTAHPSSRDAQPRKARM